MAKIQISIWLESPDGDRMEKTYIEDIEADDDFTIASEVEALILDLVFWDWKHIEDIEEEKPSKPDDISRWDWKKKEA